MKIAVIRSECSYRKGGAERYAANLCKALAEAGHQVWVLAEKFDPEIHPELVHVPIKVNRATSSSRTRSFHQNSQKALASLQVDAVFALSRSYPADAFRVSDPLHRFWMRIRYPGKLRRFLQSLNPRHRTILRMEAAIFDPANTRMIITNSQLSKTILREYYNYPAERIHVVYNGVDRRQFTPADRSPGENHSVVRLLFIGQDFKRKGLAALVEALAIVVGNGCDARLKVIGRGNPESYRALAVRLGIADRIDFEGPSSKIQHAYQAADLFVFPTSYDPFANVCLEALACGLPVLTTTTNGASEIIAENREGYVVAGEAGGLAERLAWKIGDFCRLSFEQRLEMHAASHAKAGAFTIERNAEMVADLLARKPVS